MKEDFERIIQSGLRELEARQEMLETSRERVQKTVEETRGKLEALRDMAEAIELRTLKDWDAILVGIFNYPTNGNRPISHVRLELGNRNESLDVFHETKALREDKRYRVVLLFQEIPEAK